MEESVDKCILEVWNIQNFTLSFEREREGKAHPAGLKKR